MAVNPIGLNQGSQVFTRWEDDGGTVNTQVVDVRGLAAGTVNLLKAGTINTIGTLSGLGTLPGVGTVSAMGSLTSVGTILGIGGTVHTDTVVNVGSVTVGTITVGTIAELTNLVGGTITKLGQGSINVTAGTIRAGTVDILSGTVTRLAQGSINVTAGTITSGSIVVTAGTVAAHAITAATVTAGTINAGTVSLIHGGTVVGTAQPLPVTIMSGVATGYAEGTTVGTISGDAIVFRNAGGTLTTVQVGGSALPTNLDSQVAGEDLTNDVMGVIQKPVGASTYAPSEHLNMGVSAGTGVLIKNSTGNVYAFDVTSVGTAVRYFQLFNQGTVAVVGQTPVASYTLGSVPDGDVFRLQVSSSDLAPSRYFSTGIAAAISSTQGTLGTANIIIADYSWHIKFV